MSGVERAIDSIIVGDRIRKELRDLEPLKASIRAFGLLQPITITPDGVLLCGFRRLAAVRELGRRTIEVHVVAGLSPDLGRLMAERDENVVRTDFTTGELATMYEQMKRVLEDDARIRQLAGLKVGNLAGARSPIVGERGEVAKTAALLITGKRSEVTFERVLEMRRIADDTAFPAELRRLAAEQLARIDAGGTVATGYAATKRAQQEHALAASLSRLDLDPGIRAALQARLDALFATKGRSAKAVLQQVRAATATTAPVMFAPVALADFLDRSADIRTRFDPAAVAAQFDQHRLATLDRFVDEWVAFRDEVHARRAG